jgi:hypothetical protein
MPVQHIIINHWPIHIFIILWRVETLVCNKRETGGYTRAVSEQRLCKHVLAATNRRTTIEVLLETGCFFVVRAEDLS